VDETTCLGRAFTPASVVWATVAEEAIGWDTGDRTRTRGYAREACPPGVRSSNGRLASITTTWRDDRR
jgi:hypothetical protein